MLQPPKNLNFGRITEFEGLRALLAWWVFVGHALVFSGFTTSSSLPIFVSWLLENGYAVDVFIILSGFVIFLLLDTNLNKSYAQFMIERFFRIYPIYIIALLFGIASLTIQSDVFTNASWNDPTISNIHLRIISNGNNNFISHLISHVFLIHGMIPDQLLADSSLTFISQSWSLSLEWQFYLIAPLLIILLRNSNSLWISLLLLTVTVLSRILFSKFSFGFGAFLPIKMEFFVVGILSYYFYRFTQSSKRFASVNTLLLLLLSAIIGIISLSFFPSKIVSGRAIPIAIWLLVLSAAIARSKNSKFKIFCLISDFLNHPFLQYLGKFSYSTYLFHLLIIYPLLWFVMVVSPNADKSIVLLVLLLLGTVSTIVVSLTTYRFLEKPFISFGKRLSERI
jgi:peptidoglycan/LPS O-acetylase OafA/YrhL